MEFDLKLTEKPNHLNEESQLNTVSFLFHAFCLNLGISHLNRPSGENIVKHRRKMQQGKS